MNSITNFIRLISLAMEDLNQSIFLYQERRFGDGGINCRIYDFLYLFPAILGFIAFRSYPKPFDEMLLAFSWTYLALFFSGKIMIFLIWEAKATPKTSRFVHPSSVRYGRHPDDSKALLFWFLLIMIVASSVGSRFFLDGVSEAQWVDPTAPRYRYESSASYYDRYRQTVAHNRERHIWNKGDY